MTVLAFVARPIPVETVIRLPLGMAQLALDGLSEQWVLRFCGDQHWALIAKALGQQVPVFRAADGRPVYAAFCTTSLRMLNPSAPLLGREVDVESALFAVSETRTGSQHRLLVAGEVVAELSMISTFVSHDRTASNTRIFRNSVLGDMHLPQADTALMQLDRYARDKARSLRESGPESAPEIHAERPTPSLDFNAVGLLYFPTFARIAETAAYARSGRSEPILRRDIVYLGNINQGDAVHVFDQGATLVMTRGDGTPIAAVRSLTTPA